MMNTDPLPGLDRTCDPVTQQVAQASHDRQAKTQAALPLARVVADLVVFVEHRLQFAVRNTDTRVPDLDPKRAAAPAATHQHPALIRVFQRVCHEVA